MKLDIIIPCYNAVSTLDRAVGSCLRQDAADRIWLVDDASSDGTWAKIQSWAERYPDRISIQRLPENGGVSRARNWGALCSGADLTAFLDADDAYAPHALDAVKPAFAGVPELGLVRLKLRAVGLPPRYAGHPDLAHAWRILEMTVGGNTVFRRAFFLACGGFPQHGLFRVFGGEDGALGIAATRSSMVGTLFDDDYPPVLHYCRDGMHAERLLDAQLFGKADGRIGDAELAFAEGVTADICTQLAAVRQILNVAQAGVAPLMVAYEESGKF